MNPLDDHTFGTFTDLGRLAGHRDDLISRLAHVRAHIDRTLANGHAGGTSVADLADAAGLSRESAYQAITRHERAAER